MALGVLKSALEHPKSALKHKKWPQTQQDSKVGKTWKKAWKKIRGISGLKCPKISPKIALKMAKKSPKICTKKPKNGPKPQQDSRDF